MDAEIHPARLPATPVSCLHCQATAQTRKFTRKAAKSNPLQELLCSVSDTGSYFIVFFLPVVFSCSQHLSCS